MKYLFTLNDGVVTFYETKEKKASKKKSGLQKFFKAEHFVYPNKMSPQTTNYVDCVTSCRTSSVV